MDYQKKPRTGTRIRAGISRRLRGTSACPGRVTRRAARYAHPGRAAGARASRGGPRGGGARDEGRACAGSGRKSDWSRADLIGELRESMPAGAARCRPQEAARLIEELADRALAGEAGPVECLTAPEWPAPPPDLIRDLDGRSIYTRPGASRYATHVQLSREEELVQRAQRTGRRACRARRPRSSSARPWRTWRRGCASRRTRRSCARCCRAGCPARRARWRSRRSRRRAARGGRERGRGHGEDHARRRDRRGFRPAGLPVAGTAPSQTATNELRAAIKAPGVEQRAVPGPPGRPAVRGARPAVPAGGVLVMDEAGMTAMADAAELVGAGGGGRGQGNRDRGHGAADRRAGRRRAAPAGQHARPRPAAGPGAVH